MYPLGGGILTWSGAEWAINIGLIFGAVGVGIGTLMTAMYPWFKRIANDVTQNKIAIAEAERKAIEARTIASTQQTKLDLTATTATEAKTTANIATAAARNIRNDLTVVQASIPTVESIQAAVSAVLPLPTPPATEVTPGPTVKFDPPRAF